MSTVLFMTAVHVEEPKESEGALGNRMMHTRDGATSGSERSRKPGKWTRILEERSMMTRSTHSLCFLQKATKLSATLIDKSVAAFLDRPRENLVDFIGTVA